MSGFTSEHVKGKGFTDRFVPVLAELLAICKQDGADSLTIDLDFPDGRMLRVNIDFEMFGGPKNE